MRWLVFCAAAAALLGGCGPADDRDDVSAVVERFSRAVASGDGAAACRQLSEGLVDAIEQDSGDDCSEAITDEQRSRGPTAAPKLFITSASVRLGASTVFLDRAGDRWRITALGCMRESGRPAEAPLECEAEA